MLAGGGLVDYCLSFAYVRSLHSPPRPVPARNVRRTTTDREVRGYQARGQSGSGSRQKACEFVIVRRHCFRACILCAVGALPETKNPPSGGSPEAGFKNSLRIAVLRPNAPETCVYRLPSGSTYNTICGASSTSSFDANWNARDSSRHSVPLFSFFVSKIPKSGNKSANGLKIRETGSSIAAGCSGSSLWPSAHTTLIPFTLRSGISRATP